MKILFICFGVLFWGCNTPKKTIYIEKITNHAKSVSKINTSFLPVENFGNWRYFSSLILDKNEYLSIIKNDSIYVIDLSNGKTENTIPIVKLNIENDDEKINSFFFVSFNEFIITTKKHIYHLLNNKWDSLEINFNRDKYLLYDIENFPTYYSKSDSSLYFQKYCTNCGQANTSYYKLNIVAKVNLKTNKESNLSLHYSDLYLENYYGFANHVYGTMNDSLIVVSFPVDPNIYYYFTKNDSLSVVGGRSKYHIGVTPPLDKKNSKITESKMQHLAVIPFYQQILIDHNNQYVYRFFGKEQNLKNTKGEYNNLFSKDKVLQIFNAKLQLEQEIDIDRMDYNFFSFTGNNKIYIKSYNRETKQMGFKIISINNE